MKTFLRKHLGASAGAGVYGSILVFALTGLIASAPQVAGAAEVTARYMRFTCVETQKDDKDSASSTGKQGEQGVAFYEFRACYNGADLAPAGMSIIDATAPNSGLQASYLLDGKGSNGSTKYWTSKCPVTFTLDMGSEKTVDGYAFQTADVQRRNPISWMVEVSNDKTSWTCVDMRNVRSKDGAVALNKNTWQRYTFDNTPPEVIPANFARYVRFTCTNKQSGGLALSKFDLLSGGISVVPAQTMIIDYSAPNAVARPSQMLEPDSRDAKLGKYWTGATTPTFTYDLGKAVRFDSYLIRMADHKPRNPIAWRVEVSADKQTWQTVDEQDVGDATAAQALGTWGGGDGEHTYTVNWPQTGGSASVSLTGRSVNFVLGACGDLGADLTGNTLYGVAPYRVAGKGWNNLAPTSTAQGGSFTLSEVKDASGLAVSGATFAVTTHGAVNSIAVSDTSTADATVTSDYCLLPAGSDKMAVFRENSDGEDSFVFTGVPYQKFAVVLYLGQGGATADGHDYVTVSQTRFHGFSASGKDKVYETKYTYADGKLTIVDGDKIADGTDNVGVWGGPTVNWSNQEGEGVMILPNQIPDKYGNYTFRLSQLNNNGKGASWRSLFRGVQFVELAADWHDPLKEGRDAFGFVLGKFSNGKGEESLPSDGYYGLNGYAMPGSAWNPLAWAGDALCTVSEVKNRNGEILEGVGLSFNGGSTASYAPENNHNNPRVLPPFSQNTAYTQKDATATLTGIPYKRYTLLLYLTKDQGWYDNKVLKHVTLTANGISKNYTYVDGVLTEGTDTWGAYTQAGIIGLEGVGVMVIRGLTASDLVVKTNGGSYNSQFQGLQIVEETTYDAELRSGVKMLHRFDFEQTMTVGSNTRVAPVDKGAGGKAYPISTDISSHDLMVGEGKFGSRGLRVCRGSNGLSGNSDGFKLRNQQGLGADVRTGFTLSYFLKVGNEEAWRGVLAMTIGDPFKPDSKGISLRQEMKGKGSGNQTIYASAGSLTNCDSVVGKYKVGQWVHVAYVVRPATAEDAAVIPNCTTAIDIYTDGEKSGTYGLPTSDAILGSKSLVLKELIVGRTRRSSGQTSNDENNSNYYNNPNWADIDEVALFDRPLSAEGIAWLSTHEAAVPPTETASALWQAAPSKTASVGEGSYSHFKVRFNGAGFKHAGAQAPKNVSGSVFLHQMAMAWRDGASLNAAIRRVALVNAEGTLVAVSRNAKDRPLDKPMSTVFEFPEGTAVDAEADYTVYFTGGGTLNVGDAFDASQAKNGRFLCFGGASAGDGFYLPDAPTYAPMASFTLSREATGVSEVVVNGDAINITYTTGSASRLDSATKYGLVPFAGSKWNWPTSMAETAITDSAGKTGITVSATARVLEDQNQTSMHPLLRDALVDNYASPYAGATVTISGIPYAEYDVYVYLSANAWSTFGPISVNDGTVYYTMPEGAEEAEASSTQVKWGNATSAAWGAVTLGKNVMRIAGLSGSNLKLTAHRMQSAQARGNIAAIQIVERRTLSGSTWVGTLSASAEASAVTVTSADGSQTTTLDQLGEADILTLTVTANATITFAQAQKLGFFTVDGVGALTLAGEALTISENLAVEGSCSVIPQNELSAVSATLAEGTTLGLSGTRDYGLTISGAGSVDVLAGANVALTNADSDYSGGTVVHGTLRWAGVAALGSGSVRVPQGGVFDLGGYGCSQAVVLAGGTLSGADVAGDQVFSANFNPGSGTANASAENGLLPMLGSYWVDYIGASGSDQDISLVSSAAMGAADADTLAVPKALSWSCTATWTAAHNTANFMKGYLDDTGSHTLTLALPAELAARGYDVYLYSNTDVNSTFSARDVTGDDGETVSYTYVDGVLTAGAQTGWGSSNAGRNTLDEGTNVMVLPNRMDRKLTVNFPNRNGRGGVAAIQGRIHAAAYRGALTVESDSFLTSASGTALNLNGAVVDGAGKLTKQGAGNLTLVQTALGTRTLEMAEGALTVGSGNTLDGTDLELASGTSGTVADGVADLALSGLSGSGSFDLNALTTLTFTGTTGANASFSGTLAVADGDSARMIVKRGALTQTVSALPAGADIGVTVEAGTFEVLSDAAQTLSRLYLTGGTFSAPGAGAAAVDYAQMASGAVNLAAAGKASSARPAMVSANDATVSRFTLKAGGTVLYRTRDDFAKYFPKGFIPQGDYQVQLGSDLADELSFPYTFTILGAADDARFTVLDSSGNPAPEGTWSADGPQITLKAVEAVLGEVGELGAPLYHYAFDGSLNAAADAAGNATFSQAAMSGSGVTYAASDNGQALSGGTPWASAAGDSPLGSGDWSLTLYARLKEMQPNAILLGIGRTVNAGALLLARGEGNTLTLWRRVADTVKEALFTAQLPGNGETWVHLTLVHTPGYYRLYVNGEQAAMAAGDFAESLAGFQVGTWFGAAVTGLNLTNWSGAPGEVDDLAVYATALRGSQLTQVVAGKMGAWRWHSAETPEVLVDPAATDWTDASGAAGTWPGEGNTAAETSAMLTLGDESAYDTFLKAVANKGFVSRQAILSGAVFSYRPQSPLTVLSVPSGLGSLCVDNDFTIDLSEVQAQVTAAVLGGVTKLKLAEGSFSGTATLRNVPEGLMLQAQADESGIALVSETKGLWSTSVDIKWDGIDGKSILYGLEGYEVIGTSWNEIQPNASGVTLSNLKLNNGTTLSGSALKVTTSGGASYTYRSGYADLMLKGVAPGPVRYAFTGIPAGTYEVLLYFSHSSNYKASPVRVIDAQGARYYTYVDGTLTSSEYVPAGWGKTNTDGYVEGQNTIKMPVTVGRDGTLTIEASDSASPTAGPGLDWSTSDGRGFTAGIQLVRVPGGVVYTRTVTDDANWAEAGAWYLADGTVAPEAEPPEDALVLLTMTDDATLTVAHADLLLQELRVYGGGVLTLNYDGSWLTDDDYRAIPANGTTMTLFEGTYEANDVRFWMAPLKYGASAVLSAEGSKVSAKLTLPDSCFPADAGMISVNFWDFSHRGSKTASTGGGGKLGDSGTAGPFATSVKHWAQPAEDLTGEKPYTQTMNLISVPYTSRGDADAAQAVLANALTFQTGGGSWDGGNSSRSLLEGFLSDRPVSSDGKSGPNANLQVKIPSTWGTYKVVLYASVNAANVSFTPPKVNGKWYTYSADSELLVVNGVAEGANPEGNLWGTTGDNATDPLVEGVNYMVIPGLSGDLSIEWFTKLTSTGGINNANGRFGLAALQIIQEGTPVLSDAKVFRAEVTGEADWATLQWKDVNGADTTAPGAADVAELILTGDAVVSAEAEAKVGTLRVYGNGYAVAFPTREQLVPENYVFLNSATLDLTTAAETLPENCSALPARLRYTYAFSGNVSTTAAYIQEFAAGYAGVVTPAGGVVEFSGGTAAFSGFPASATKTTYVFSGEVRATATQFSLGEAEMIFRDQAKGAASGLSMVDGGANRTASLELEDDASLTVSGSTNNTTTSVSLLVGHWAGTASVTLRGNASLIAEQAELFLGHDAVSSKLSLHDNAVVRVAGLSTHRTNTAGSSAIALNGGRLLIGSHGVRSYEGRQIALDFAGGAFGAWQDVTLGADAAACFSSVSGSVIFESESAAALTLTRQDPFLTDTSRKTTLRSGGLVLKGSTFSGMPRMEVVSGTLSLVDSAPAFPALTMRGGTLALEAGFPVFDALTFAGDAVVRIPLVERLSEGGYLSMTDARALPDLSRVVFDLVLNPERSETERVLPSVPLILGTYAEGAEPVIKGFGLSNNTNGAITDYQAALLAGTAGKGLYAVLKGAEVLSAHTVHLTDPTEGGGYPLIQSTVDVYPYHIFSGDVAGARLKIPEGGAALPHASFTGNTIRVVAAGDTPHVLLRGLGCTFSADVIFDLSAWAAKLPDVVRGAVLDVPASVCLLSGGVVKSPASVRLTVDLGAYTLPEGFEGAVEVTKAGVYYVVRSTRRTRTVSVNFTEAGVPLSAPPSRIGVYALANGAWNTLAGSFASSALRLSDVGGAAAETAQTADGAPTQVIAYTSLTRRDDRAPASLLRVWLDDSAAQSVRLSNLPFEAYRLAFVFSNDLEGAAYAPVTVADVPYTMDAEGYVRRGIQGYSVTDAAGNPSIDIPGDTAWGSTDKPESDAVVSLGANALVTDVLIASTVSIALPAFEYASRYAGLAALQVIEAPLPTAAAAAKAFTCTIPASGDYVLAEMTLSGDGAAWESGAENVLTVVCNETASLTLPAGFEADRIICRGSGTLTLRVVNDGGAAITALNAAQMANLTVAFPCAGVAFSPASGISRFESSFDNNGQTYLIARGATLALGENSGVVTNLDSGSADLTVDTASPGVLRRDYPVAQASSQMFPAMTLAMRSSTYTLATDNSNYNVLVEEGDTFTRTAKFHLQNPASGARWSFTQTGGTASFLNADSGQGGLLLFNNNSAAGNTAEINVSGNVETRLEATAIWAWRDQTAAVLNVSGEATLALGAEGLNARGAGSSIALTLRGKGTLEATAATLPGGGSGTVRVTLEGGRLTTAQDESALTLPLVFLGTADEPTIIAPAALSAMVLSGANSGSGVIVVSRGTLTAANDRALGGAAVTVQSGAAFEARKLTAAATGSVSFASGAQCVVTTAKAPTLPFTAQIAGAITFPDGKDAVMFSLNGAAYDGAQLTVDEAAGTVTFVEAARLTAENVTWDPQVASGAWQDGTSGPWADAKTYRNGGGVAFGTNATLTENNGVHVALKGKVAPKSLAVSASDTYTFEQGAEGAYLDASALGTTLALGSGQVYDVPIGVSTVGVTLGGGYNTFRLLGVRSNGGRTASLVGSGNVGGGSQGTHGVWFGSGYSGDITWAPHAGETQILSPFGSHLSGSGTITVTGAGTVQLAGHTGGTNWNDKFSGTFVVRDGGTLDFTMTREYSGANGDEDIYFRKMALTGTAPVLTVRNGGTVRFSGTRGLFGGWSQRETAANIQAEPIAIGYQSAVEYAYVNSSNGQQYIPYGFLMNGDNAALWIRDGAATGKAEDMRGLLVSRGATIQVAGIGEPGDPDDPKTSREMVQDPARPEDPTAQIPSENYGNLTEGITAVIDAMEGTGLSRWGNNGVNDAVYLRVGEGSTLRILANLINNTAASTGDTPFAKVGAGRLTLEYPAITDKVLLDVREGVLGGSAELTDAASAVSVAAAATIEAGLRMTQLTLAGGATLALDPTGAKVLRADRAIFTAGGTYTVVSLLSEESIPEAAQMEPVKVMAWSGVQGADSSTFVLAPALEEKGYGLEVRDDGLYLMNRTVYVRTMDFGTVDPLNPPAAVRLAWYADKAWYRQDDPATLRNYDPAENEAATALFILPDAYAPGAGPEGSTLTVPTVTLTLTRSVSFASVRFAVWAAAPTAEDPDARELVQLTVPVIYHYNLTGEEMPSGNEAKSFTWVPTLSVERPDGTSAVATVTTTVPTGYAYTLRDATVVVYASATKPAINVNFTGKAAGDVSWIDAGDNPCGAEPFAGVYWNNASAAIGSGNEYLAASGDNLLFRIYAAVAGVEPGEDGQAVTSEVVYSTVGAASVASRRGTSNAGLAAGFLKGNQATLAEDYLQQGGLTPSGTSSGWHVRVGSVPFSAFDLYLVFAGETEGAVTYPAVRIKLGSEDWRTYSLVNGWAAPAATGDEWSGIGGLVNGGFADGRNVLHFRFTMPTGSDIQIAACDGGQPSAAAASAVGLAALQIVRCEDGAENERLGTGKWSDAAGWRRTMLDSVETGRWVDATAAAPRAAWIPATSQIAADMAAATPRLRITGASTMRFTGTEGALSTGAVDLYDATSSGIFNFESNIFSQPPNIVLAPGITFTVPEDSGTVTNNWRWVYDDATRTGDNAQSSTLHKTGSGDLVLTRTMLSKLQIDDGTLWLNNAIDGAYTRSAQITGDGVFGVDGTNDLRISWNNLRTSGASNGILARVRGGVFYLHADNGSLPDGGIIQAEGSGRMVMTLNSGGQRRPFNHGLMKAINGGGIIWRKATNLFAEADRPSVLLDSGDLYLELEGGSHYHLYNLTTRGNSRLYFKYNTAQAWNREGFILWDGKLNVESGALAAYADSGQENSLFIRAVGDQGYGNGSYIHVATGAEFYSDLPIGGGNNNANRVINKVGGGIWVQTRSISNNRGNNGASWWASDVRVREGTLRLNMGTSNLILYGGTRNISVSAGARFDGAGTVNNNVNITIDANGTLASGLPAGWTGAAWSKWKYDYPAAFKGETSNSIKKLRFNGKLTMANNAILECDLSNNNVLDVDGAVTLGGNLTVRLTNLPTSLTAARKLTDFASAPSGDPIITCPEAIALDAEVVLEDGNLWLKPSASSYVWADQAGQWSDKAWTYEGEAAAAFPLTAMSTTTSPVARVQAGSASVSLGVDKGGLSLDGRDWAMKALIFSANPGQTITITEKLDPLPTPLPDPWTANYRLNTLQVNTTVWKLGTGTVRVDAPIKFFSTGADASLHVSSGTLRLTHPLIVTGGSDALNVVPAAIELPKGVALAYALNPSDAMKTIIAGSLGTTAYNPLEQTLSGRMTGAGTLQVEGDQNVITLTGTADNSVNYKVASGATLKLAGAIPTGSAGETRTLTVASKGAVEINRETALGWSPWTINLEAAESTLGATVRTSDNARLRGTVSVTPVSGAAGAVAAVLGTERGAFDGDLTFNVPAAATLTLGGWWQTPQSTASGALVKTGLGVADFTGTMASNLPMDVREGTLRISGALSVEDLNESATKADWTVQSGAALVMAGSGNADVRSGSITINSGAVLDLTGRTHTFVGAVNFASGATVRMGDGASNALALSTFVSTVAVQGTVWINLDSLDPAQLSVAGVASYPLLDFGDGSRIGSGTFQLGGNKLVAWAEAGWTLRDSGNRVTLEAFGGDEGAYTWGGDAAAVGEGNWAKPMWLAPNADAKDAWPTEGTPAVILQDDDPLTGDPIPEAARTLDWNLPAQSLAALRCDIDRGDYTLTASGGTSAELTLTGALLKTGSSALTIKRPVAFGADGALKLLGGTTEFTGTLRAVSGDFKKPITLAGSAVLSFNGGTSSYALKGLLSGDGTGAIRFNGTGSLTLGMALDDVAALTVEKGSVALTAGEQTVLAPAVTLASDRALLSYAPETLALGGDVSLRVNAVAGRAASGVLTWGAAASSETARAPRLVASADVPEGTPAVNVSELRYAPASGHLILDPGTAVLPADIRLTLGKAASESDALWLGARTDACTAGEVAFRAAALTGSGLVSVEPSVDAFADADWSMRRVLTLTLDAALPEVDRTFKGLFAGATTLDGTVIQAGLAVRSKDPSGETPRFTLTGKSTDANLGTLDVGEKVRVEVNGAWAGDVAVSANGGELAGSGVLGGDGRTVTVPAGATLSGAAFGKRRHANGSVTEETVPAALTVQGTLSLVPDSRLRVLVRQDASGAAWVSCVQAERLLLPMIVSSSNNEVMLEVVLDDEAGATASNVKILGWSSLDGAGKINGRLVAPDGTERTDYILRQKTDGLYLYRSNARFWMIVR